MTTHSPACQRVLAEFLSTPTDSIEHRIAEDVAPLTGAEALAYLLRMYDEDPPMSSAFTAAQRLLPAVIAEAVAR